ncbi:MAG: putative sulfate exporter family transporter [Acidobacteria bacterium]|nr:putative sulfate exporter family transporter [Acidobacteriota bacterium]
MSTSVILRHLNRMGAGDRLASILLLAGLALLTNRLAHAMPGVLEFPLWAVGLGLIASASSILTGLRPRMAFAFRTEFYLKVGLVLLGAGINFTDVMGLGARGMLQALIMVTCVFSFTWWLAGCLRLEDQLKAVMAAAVSICGVSAAIAAAGSVLARKEQLAYVAALVIATALPLMILLPYAAYWLQLSPVVAGAWFGGNIDTTAAVVGAGALYGEDAVKTASVVKMAQNTLIGVAAFLLALYWIRKQRDQDSQRPTLALLWERFPKFVLGFLAVSVLATIGWLEPQQVSTLRKLRDWTFVLAFTGIGWDLVLRDLFTPGIRPVIVYLSATVFNTLLALALAKLLFS